MTWGRARVAVANAVPRGELIIKRASAAEVRRALRLYVTSQTDSDQRLHGSECQHERCEAAAEDASGAAWIAQARHRFEPECSPLINWRSGIVIGYTSTHV